MFVRQAKIETGIPALGAPVSKVIHKGKVLEHSPAETFFTQPASTEAGDYMACLEAVEGTQKGALTGGGGGGSGGNEAFVVMNLRGIRQNLGRVPYAPEVCEGEGGGEGGWETDEEGEGEGDSSDDEDEDGERGGEEHEQEQIPRAVAEQWAAQAEGQDAAQAYAP